MPAQSARAALQKPSTVLDTLASDAQAKLKAEQDAAFDAYKDTMLATGRPRAAAVKAATKMLTPTKPRGGQVSCDFVMSYSYFATVSPCTVLFPSS